MIAAAKPYSPLGPEHLARGKKNTDVAPLSLVFPVPSWAATCWSGRPFFNSCLTTTENTRKSRMMESVTYSSHSTHFVPHLLALGTDEDAMVDRPCPVP